MAAFSYENVCGFDVAVYDAFRVSGVERVGDFNGECDQRLIVERAAHDHVLQRQAIQILHRDETLALVFADFVDGADIGMVEGGGGAGFATEALQSLRVLRDIVRQELEGDKAAERGVFGLVDHAHAAATQLFNDAIVRDGLANHSVE